MPEKVLKSTFKIPKMDCPSEENLIRTKLSSYPQILELKFNLQNRLLDIFHKDDIKDAEQALKSLDLGAAKESEVAIEDYQPSDNVKAEKTLLWTVLGINLAFFIIEITFGLISHSMGLVADSLDMLADSFVYGISLIAVGATVLRKKRVAKTAGIFQLLLALIGLSEVVRRFINPQEMPDFFTMIIVSIFALIANALCLYLLQKSKSEEAHMKASMIFTSNDIIINSGVILAGLLVLWTKTLWPDLVIGSIVFIIVLRGALRILKLAK